MVAQHGEMQPNMLNDYSTHTVKRGTCIHRLFVVH